MKNIEVEFTEQGIKVIPLNKEACEVIHTEEFKQEMRKMMDAYRAKLQKDKKD